MGKREKKTNLTTMFAFTHNLTKKEEKPTPIREGIMDSFGALSKKLIYVFFVSLVMIPMGSR